jgi:hypothetical protein
VTKLVDVNVIAVVGDAFFLTFEGRIALDALCACSKAAKGNADAVTSGLLGVVVDLDDGVVILAHEFVNPSLLESLNGDFLGPELDGEVASPVANEVTAMILSPNEGKYRSTGHHGIRGLVGRHEPTSWLRIYHKVLLRKTCESARRASAAAM